MGKLKYLRSAGGNINSMVAPQKKREKGKKKKKLLYDPVIPLLNIYPKELKSASQRDPLCIIELFTIVKTWK